MRRPYRVGGECDSWCTKCREITLHKIIAMIDGLPKRVICSICSGQHNYRSGQTKSTAPRRKATTRTSPQTWKRIVDQRDESAVRVYRFSEEFETDDLLDHSRFGLGVVKKVLPGDKIEVLFQGGARVLVHNRTWRRFASSVFRLPSSLDFVSACQGHGDGQTGWLSPSQEILEAPESEARSQ